MAEPSPARRSRRPNPLAELALPGSAVGRELRYPIIAAVVLSVVAVVICYLLVGTAFAIIGGGLVVANFSYRLDPGRPAAMVAFLFAVGAALATVLEQRPQAGDPTLLFAAARPGASTAGNMAGALMTVAAIMFGLTERTDGAHTIVSLEGPLRWLGRLPARVRSAHVIATWVPVLSSAVIGVGLHTALGAAAVPDTSHTVVRNVRLGAGFATVLWSPASQTADFAPLGIVVAAFNPLGDRAALVAADVLLVVLVARLATLWRGRRAGAAAALVVAAMPAVWDAPLSVTLAALFSVAAVVVRWPQAGESADATKGRGAAAGLLAGLAVLSRPDALILVPALAAWPFVAASVRGAAPRSAAARRDLVRSSVALLAAALAVCAPWLNYVWSNFQVPFVATSVGAFAGDPGRSHRLPGLVVVAADLAVVVATVLVGPRHVRHAPIVTQWRRVLPLVAVPVGSIALGLARPLDRGLLSWAAPFMAVLLACQWASVRSNAPRPDASGAGQAGGGASTSVAL